MATTTITNRITLQNMFDYQVAGNVFDSHLDNFRHMRLIEVVNKKVGDLVLFRSCEYFLKNGKKESQVVEYIGRIWKSHVAEIQPIFSTTYIIQILYKREWVGQTLQWVRHDEHLFNSYSESPCVDGKIHYFNYYRKSKRDCNIDIEAVKHLMCEDLKSLFFEKNYCTMSDYELTKTKQSIFKIRNISYHYFEIPTICSLDRTQISRLLSESISPKDVEEIIEILFNRFTYDIYRNIIDFI